MTNQKANRCYVTFCDIQEEEGKQVERELRDKGLQYVLAVSLHINIVVHLRLHISIGTPIPKNAG